MSQYGIVIVSHVRLIAEGTKELIAQIAKKVSVTITGGVGDVVGTNVEDVQKAIEENPADEILAFYDLGSSKMNLEVCADLTDKTVHVFDVPIVEGAYSAAALAEVGTPIKEISKQLGEIVIK